MAYKLLNSVNGGRAYDTQNGAGGNYPGEEGAEWGTHGTGAGGSGAGYTGADIVAGAGGNHGGGSGGAAAYAENVNVNAGGDGLIVITYGSTPTRVFLTTTGAHTWDVPEDWDNDNNLIECVGAGGSGGSCIGTYSGGSGGGGGAYARKKNLSLTPNSSIDYTVGAGGPGGGGNRNGSAGGDTWFNGQTLAASSVGAKGGGAGAYSNYVIYATVYGGAGGNANDCIGDLKLSGGSGGNLYNSGTSGTGGGGAAGPFGIGENGHDLVTPAWKGSNGGHADKGTIFIVPDDWSNQNLIECVGGGGSGGARAGSGPNAATGGGGGAYANLANLELTPGDIINLQVGAGGAAQFNTDGGGAAGQDTWFIDTSTLLAKGGGAGNSVPTGTRSCAGGAGGDAGASIGDVTHSGGRGGNSGDVNVCGTGGGGAAGPYGPGLAGVDLPGTPPNSTSGGAGDNGYGGDGGTARSTGLDGTEWLGGDSGSGGGGGGAGYNNGASVIGGNGGLYGGGGGGACSYAEYRQSGAGADGLILITYTAAGYIQPHYRFRTDSESVDANPTWGADQDADIYPGVENAFRLRMSLGNVNQLSGSHTVQLYVSRNDGPYQHVDENSTMVRGVDIGSNVQGDQIEVPRLTTWDGKTV